MANTYKKLETVTVGAGGVSSISFTSIPQTYTDLVIKLSSRSSNPYIDINFNGLATNFSSLYGYGNGSSVGGGTQAKFLGVGSSTSNTANTFGNLEVIIANYVSSQYKSYSAYSAQETNAASAEMHTVAGLWSNTAAITSIQIYPEGSGTFSQYTTATLYGIFKADVSSVPSAPTIGTANVGNLSASVTFTVVSDAASYTMTSSPGGITETGTTSPIRVSGLTAGTAYTFTCKANNPLGASAFSAASNSVTPTTPGVTWAVQTGALNTADGWEDVTYGDGLYLTSPTNVVGKISYSTNGTTWSSISTATTGSPYWSGNAYGAGVYSISNRAQAGAGYQHMWSYDCRTWTYGTGGSNAYLPKLAWNGVAFFVGGQGFNYGDRSTDGKTWSAITLPSADGWGGIAGRSGYFVLLQDGGSGPTNVSASSSDNGSTWTARTITATAQRWQAAAYDTAGTKCVAVARTNNAAAYTTNDGASWTAATMTSGTWVDITYGDGYWIAVGWGNCATSPDGITWTARTIPAGTSGGGEGITYGPKGALVVQYGTSNTATAF